jgi:hypothetical protein
VIVPDKQVLFGRGKLDFVGFCSVRNSREKVTRQKGKEVGMVACK